MKRDGKIKKSQRGFTLLEVIITIVIASILGSILVSFMGTAITRSSDPVRQTRELGEAIGIIEIISADYISYVKTGSPTWQTIKDKIYTTAPNATLTKTTITNFNTTTLELVKVKVTVGDQTVVSYFMI